MATEQTPIWIQLVIPALTAVSATLGTLFVSQWKAVKDAKEVSASEQTATRLKFLDPLRLATEDLAWKWWVIEGKIREHRPGSGGLDWMVNTFHCIKEPQEILHRPLSEKEFCFWCNGEGFFSVSAIYVTAVYFHHAWRTRREYIIDKELIMKLDTVRVAFGHEYGIYTILQDSIGEYMRGDDKTQIGYRTFCTNIYQEDERLWLLNMLDYFREINRKTDEQRAAISIAIKDLLVHLGDRTMMTVRLPYGWEDFALPKAQEIAAQPGPQRFTLSAALPRLESIARKSWGAVTGFRRTEHRKNH